MNAVTSPENMAVATSKPAAFDLSPQTFEQALTFSNYLAESDMVPKDFKGKPGNCLVAIQWGMEIGLKPLQAMQNIAVINGRPSLWGDAVIALARNSPVCEYIVEEDDGRTATCRVKRRGEAEQVRTFGMDDAKLAGLIGKQGPWTQYPKRMRQMRARAFAIRDVFPDVLKGLPVAEEIMDTPPPRDMGTAQVVKVQVPEALLTEATDAASKGVTSYQAFWTATGAENRKLLADQHPSLKQQASDADKNRTVENAESAPTGEPEPTQTAQPSPDTPVVTFAKVMDMLTKAKNEDALHVAADWIGEVPDPDDRATLSKRYDTLLEVMRTE